MTSLRQWALPGAVLLGMLVLVVSFRVGRGDGGPKGGDGDDGSYRVYVPTGYIDEVDRLIGEGKLEYVCTREQIRPRGLDSTEEIFLRNSYLRGDLAAWNDGDRRPFVVEHEERSGGRCDGRVVAVNASYHKQRLPSYVADHWRGSLFLRPSTGGVTLTSSRRTLEVIPSLWDLLPLPATAYEDAYFRASSPGVRSQRLAFKLDDPRRDFARLKILGNSAVIESTDDQRLSMSLNGCPVDLGWRARLDAGDRLRVEASGRLDELYTVETGRRAGLVSFVSEVNGAQRRRTFSDRLGMAREITWAIDAAVLEARELPNAPARSDFDVHLTLDPFFTQRLEADLSTFARGRYARRPLRAAITLLEPSSGRLLALASYPTQRDLDSLRPAPSSARRQVLSRNHNFLSHPVGSAAKPFLAAAALATHPELAGLRVPCVAEGAEPPPLLGFDLGGYQLQPDCQGAAADGTVDFESFLAVSSNRYMLVMGLLALAEWEGGAPRPDRAAPRLGQDDRYLLGGRRMDTRPFSTIFKPEDTAAPVRAEQAGSEPEAVRVELKDVVDQPFLRRFRDLFSHEIHYRRGPMVEGLDLGFWRPVIDQTLGDMGHPATVSFSPIAPEQVNLRANLIQHLRQDLYTTLLGNGNNRWSNIQLAEALARVVTGRPVRARLLERVTVTPSVAPGDEEAETVEVLWDLERELERRAEERWDLGETERSLVLDGMRAVVESRVGDRFVAGTARDLERGALAAINRDAPDGVRYSALGKTGTPTSMLRTVERGPTVPAQGAIVGYSGNRQVQSAMLVLAVHREAPDADPERSDLVLVFHIEGQGGSAEAVALANTVLRPLVEAYWPEDWLRPQ